MPDYREELYKNTINRIAIEDLEEETLDRIKTILAAELSQYEITERCTEVAVIDSSNEIAVKTFIASMITENRSKKTIMIYKRTIERFLNDVSKPIAEIGAFDVRGWLAKLQMSGTSACSCENYRSYLSSFFKFLCQEAILEKNPMQNIRPVKFTYKIQTSFTEVEIDQLRSACKDLRERSIIELLLSSGVRVEELVNLKLSDIDFRKLEVKVRDGKGGKMRITYMSEVCAKHLQDYLDQREEDAEYVIWHDDNNRNSEHVSTATVRKILKDIAKRKCVPDVHPHKFRHTFATTLYRRGVDLRVIQKLMGHSNVNTTMVYIDSINDELATAYKKCS